MDDLKISEMLEMQYNLWEKHKDKWSPMEPKSGRNMLLYMIEEIGEVISIIKKKGEKLIVEDKEIRAAFVQEMADVLMYFCDFANRFGITSEELSKTFVEKHKHNLGRDYEKQYEALIIKPK